MLYAKMRYDKKMDEKTLLEQVIKGFRLESEISSEQITYLMNILSCIGAQTDVFDKSCDIQTVFYEKPLKKTLSD